jgi:heme/copper-type cytochrome/quinol oxidase subunit 2
MSLKERSIARPSPFNSYLAAITVIAIGGLSLMLGGSIALKQGAEFHEDMVAFFMLMTFVIVGVVELHLCRQLARLTRTSETREPVMPQLQAGIPGEIHGPQARSLGEPVPSVTENTTRTLQYSRNEPLS